MAFENILNPVPDMDPDESVPIDATTFLNHDFLQPYPPSIASSQPPLPLVAQDDQMYFDYPFDWSQGGLEGMTAASHDLMNMEPSNHMLPSVPDLYAWEGGQSSVSPATDYRGGDDSGEVQLINESNTQNPAADDDQLVCYGMLFRMDVNPPSAKKDIDNQLKNGPEIVRFAMDDRKEHVALLFKPGENAEKKVDLGYLRSNLTKPLRLLMTAGSRIEVEGVARAADLRNQLEKIQQSNSLCVKVGIYFYGPQSASSRVKADLAKAQPKLWLQKPDWPREGYEYKNPHLISFPGIEFTPRDYQKDLGAKAPASREGEGSRLDDLMSEVYDSTSRADHLLRSEGSSMVKTPLLDHQQQALSFMLQRESGNIPEEYRLWKYHDGQNVYRHVITGEERFHSRPEEKGGGLLADEMGMGKTLSMISLIARTLGEAQDAAAQANEKNDPSISHLNFHTRATLIIVSQELLIDNWVEEIEDHLKEGLTFTKVKYHGPGRRDNIKDMLDADVVITTYNTLNAEYQRAGCQWMNSPLHKIGWARVVLDEAHIIRRRNTQFHQCCTELRAKSRWCLTGTPIQNSLDDLASLFKFLLQDDSKAQQGIDHRHHRNEFLLAFRKQIKEPFEKRRSEALLKTVKELLVKLMDSLCLRRTRQVLNLPEVVETPREVTLNDEERQQYELTKSVLTKLLHMRLGKAEKMSEFGQFQINLQLRIMCNHGTFQKLHSWTKNKSIRDRIEGGDFNERRCSLCEETLTSTVIETVCVLFDECNHVVCNTCAYNKGGVDTLSPSQKTMRSCPKCDPVSPSPTPEDDESPSGSSPSLEPTRKRKRDSSHSVSTANTQRMEEPDEQYFNLEGHSTKIAMLIDDIKKDLSSTKGIVFSQWTRTLNLIGIHLTRERIPFLRFDGNHSHSQRRDVLSQFSREDGPRILLMTTGTGAFGLNLTDANRVFIVEPQWNPSVEDQAIARAIRLKQESKVHVTRYQVKYTVEDTIAILHKTKKYFARLGFHSDESRAPAPAAAAEPTPAIAEAPAPAAAAVPASAIAEAPAPAAAEGSGAWLGDVIDLT